MSSKTLFNRLLLQSTPLRAALTQPQQLLSHPKNHYSTSVIQPSFWSNLIPKPFRHSATTAQKKEKSKEWNPGTFYIWIYLLIGSMSIQMIALRMRFNTAMSRADAKISLLKEVIERVRKGENIDVAGLLGKGDPQQEAEWEEVLREVENEHKLLHGESDNKAQESEPEAPKQQAPVEPPPKTKAPSGFY